MEKFEIVYRSSFREVYLYLLKLTKDEHLAEELTAETFFRAINRLDKFRGDSSMKSYLIQIGKNAYFDYLRERKKFNDEEIDLMTSEAEVEATVIDEESKNLLYEALSLPTLPPIGPTGIILPGIQEISVCCWKVMPYPTGIR